jgi:hypothetical protein
VKLYSLLPSWDTSYGPCMVNLDAENDMSTDFLSTRNDGTSLCGDEELAW